MSSLEACAGDGAVHGFADPSFAKLREVFEANFASGLELGASVAVTLAGRPVVDLWSGWADEDRTRPWRQDTIVNVFSTTKTVMALTALLIADRGELDLDAPVARYWPEFAANGKAEVKVSQLLAHSSGLSGWKAPMDSADLYDWDKATSRLAAQAPFWEPGTASGYHGVTQGYLVGEVVRRVTGRSIGTVFRQEIAEPLGADFRFGATAQDDGRIAEITPPRQTLKARSLTELMTNIAVNPPLDPLATRTRAWREAEIPAANGHGNARSVAKVLSILANGGEAGGRRFMSEAGCRKAAELQIEGMDLVLGVPARFGLGFGLPGEWLSTPNSNCLFWTGWGGSIGFVDMDARISFAYAMNRMADGMLVDKRPYRMIRELWAQP